MGSIRSVLHDGIGLLGESDRRAMAGAIGVGDVDTMREPPDVIGGLQQLPAHRHRSGQPGGPGAVGASQWEMGPQTGQIPLWSFLCPTALHDQAETGRISHDCATCARRPPKDTTRFRSIRQFLRPGALRNAEVAGSSPVPSSSFPQQIREFRRQVLVLGLPGGRSWTGRGQPRPEGLERADTIWRWRPRRRNRRRGARSGPAAGRSGRASPAVPDCR
jgi:hypothetical protein